ncbi:MAG: hypothetical protein KA275_04670 [Chitinophagaceae bacterium]|nr:hypothetical protein [Chitinophagaceae bacterium]
MKRLKNNVFLIIILCWGVLNSCKFSDNTNLNFVEKYGNEDFSIFKNFKYSVRSKNRKDNLIIMVFRNINSCGFICINLNNSDSIIEKKFVCQKKICDCDTNYLILKDLYKFINYDIFYLEVDSTDNVFVKTNLIEGKPNLVRINNNNFFLNSKDKKWNKIKNNWYEATEE